MTEVPTPQQRQDRRQDSGEWDRAEDNRRQAGSAVGLTDIEIRGNIPQDGFSLVGRQPQSAVADRPDRGRELVGMRVYIYEAGGTSLDCPSDVGVRRWIGSERKALHGGHRLGDPAKRIEALRFREARVDENDIRIQLRDLLLERTRTSHETDDLYPGSSLESEAVNP